MPKRRLVAADLFCGAGGLSVGFVKAGFHIAFANDINPDCARTYTHNHPHTEFFHDSIENLSARQIFKATGLRRGDIDVLIGGPPCQGFSINAPKRDVRDKRNYLFKHYGRLVLEGLRPKVIVMENVPGMLSFEDGSFVHAIYEVFGQAGYRMKHMVLCSAHYGVPQERWRLFLIGTLLKDPDITFPFPTHWAPVRANFTGGRSLTWITKVPSNEEAAQGQRKFRRFITAREAIGDLPKLGVLEGSEVGAYNGGPYTEYQRTLRERAEDLFNHVAGRLSPQNLLRLRHIPPGGNWRSIPFRLLPRGMQRARRSDHTRRYGRIDPNGLSGTIMTKCDPHWGSFFHYSQDRALTVREAARFQSFPDSFQFLGSKVSQFVQVGNAVPPILAEAIAKHIKKNFFA